MSYNANKFRKTKSNKHNQKCTATPKKRRYRDTKEAQRALSTMRHLGRKELAETGKTKWHQDRYYECPDCNGYHTTSQGYKSGQYTKAA